MEEEEQEDIYFDLPQYDLGNENAKLRIENDAYKTEIENLETQLAALKTELNQLHELRDREKQIFLVNISELYKTAKAETDRKDRTIGELRRQLDNVIFRRDRGNFQHKRPRDEVPNEEVVVPKRLKENVTPVVEESRQHGKQESDKHHEKEAKLVVKDDAPKNERRPRSRSREVHRKRNNGERSRSNSKDRKKDRHRDDRKNGAHRDHRKREISPTSHRSTPEALRHIYHKNGRKTPDKDRSTRHKSDTQKSSTREHCDSKHHERLSSINMFDGLVVVDDNASPPKKSDKSAKDRPKTRHDKSRSNSSSSKRSQKSDSNIKPDGLKKEMPKSDRPNEKADDSVEDLRQKLNVLKDTPKDKTDDHREAKEDRLMERKEDHVVAMNEKTCHTEIKQNRLENGTKANHERSSSMKIIRRTIKKPSPKKQTTVQKAFASLKIQRGRMKRDECSSVLNNDEVRNVEKQQENFEEGEITEEPKARRVEETLKEQKDARLEEHKDTGADKDKAQSRKSKTTENVEKGEITEEPKARRVEEILKKQKGARLEEYKDTGADKDKAQSRRSKATENFEECAITEEPKARRVEEPLKEQKGARLEEHKDTGSDKDKAHSQRMIEESKDKRTKEREVVKKQHSVKLEEYKRRRLEEEKEKTRIGKVVEEKHERLEERTDISVRTADVEEQKNGRTEDCGINEEKLRETLEVQIDRRVKECETVKEVVRAEECQRREERKGDKSPTQKDGTLEEQKSRKVEERKTRKVEEQKGRRVKEQTGGRRDEFERRKQKKDEMIPKQKDGRLEKQKGRRLEEQKRGKVEELKGDDRVKDQRNESVDKRKEGNIEKRQEQGKEKLKQEITERKESNKEARTEREEEYMDTSTIEALLAQRKFELEMLQKKSDQSIKNRTTGSSVCDNLTSAGGFASQVLGAPDKSEGETKTLEENSESTKEAKKIDESRLQQAPTECRSQPRPEEKPRVSRHEEKPRGTRPEEKPKVTRPEEKPKIATRPEEKPKIATRPEEKPKVTTRPEEKPRVTRPEEKPKVTTRPEEKPRLVTRPQEKPKSKFRRNLEAVTKHLFTTAENERDKPEKLPNERIAPAAPEQQTILTSILNSKDTNENNDRRITKSLFDTPCKAVVDAVTKPEFQEPKKERRKSDPVAKPRKSNDGPPPATTNGEFVDDEEPPRRVLRSQTKAMRASPNVAPFCSSPIKKPEDPPDKSQKPHMLFQDLNLSDMNLNPENLVTYDLSHDGAIPCLHISDSFNNVQLEHYVDIARGFDDVVASTPLPRTAEQIRAQLREDLGTSSSSDSKLTPDLSSKSAMVQDAQKQSQPTASVPGSNVSTVRRRRRCIVTLVD